MKKKKSEKNAKGMFSKVIQWLHSKSAAMSFVKGVLAAVSLSTVIVPKITDLSKYETLKAFHAILVAWEKFTSAVGQFIGLLPFIPDVPGWMINAAIVSSALAPSFVVVIMKRFPAIAKPMTVDGKTFANSIRKASVTFLAVSAFGVIFLGIPQSKGLVLAFKIFLMCFLSLVVVTAVFIKWSAKYSDEDGRLKIILPTVVMIYTIFGNFSAISKSNGIFELQAENSIYLILTALLLLLMFIVAITQKKFRNPFFVFFGFVLCMEALYWLNVPELSEWVNVQTQTALEKNKV